MQSLRYARSSHQPDLRAAHPPRLAALVAALVAACVLLLAPPAPARATTTPNRLLVVGDSWTKGVGDRNPDNGYGWSPITAQLLNARLECDGVAGSGYVNKGSSSGDNRFDARVYRHTADGYRWVVLQGSTNDKAYLKDLPGWANMTMRAAKRRYPDAVVVVVGPVSIGGSSDATTLGVRDTLRRYAAYNDLPFIDGIDQGWFVPGDWSRYADPATGHPNDAAYQRIGQKIAANLANLS